MSHLHLQSLSKDFRGTPAVKNVTLEIRSGEFFSILGPSGCGKTTLLRMIAGFESPSSGQIFVGGKEITHVPPQERAIGMVFQNYALFPHMTVYENIAFGLETRKVPKAKIRPKVEKILDAVHLAHKIHASVPELSGGEQQRVAVARALVIEPTVLLLDEPLSNLDVALRVRTREEIRSLQQQIQITTVYVTHDQSEAMSLSDRVAVMQAGEARQIGSPAEIYEKPESIFVAEFLGGANIIRRRTSATDRGFFVEDVETKIPSGWQHLASGNVALAIKPEAIRLTEDVNEGLFRGVVQHKEYLGFTTNFVIDVSGTALRVAALSGDATVPWTPGNVVGITFEWSRCVGLPLE